MVYFFCREFVIFYFFVIINLIIYYKFRGTVNIIPTWNWIGRINRVEIRSFGQWIFFNLFLSNIHYIGIRFSVVIFVIEFFVIGRIYKRDIGNERNLIARIF